MIDLRSPRVARASSRRSTGSRATAHLTTKMRRDVSRAASVLRTWLLLLLLLLGLLLLLLLLRSGSGSSIVVVKGQVAHIEIISHDG